MNLVEFLRSEFPFQDFAPMAVQQLLTLEPLCWLVQRYVNKFICYCLRSLIYFIQRRGLHIDLLLFSNLLPSLPVSNIVTSPENCQTLVDYHHSNQSCNWCYWCNEPAMQDIGDSVWKDYNRYAFD